MQRSEIKEAIAKTIANDRSETCHHQHMECAEAILMALELAGVVVARELKSKELKFNEWAAGREAERKAQREASEPETI